MNESLAHRVIQECAAAGINEFCLCPGARNAPLYQMLMKIPSLKKYFWPEERSAAFFALGRSKSTGMPTAIITTSGTAAGELLPATMEAYYSGIPLLLITADRPTRFRGTGAPQAAEQKNLFGVYAPFSLDIDKEESCSLQYWKCDAPAHLNVCFEEPFPKKTESPRHFSLAAVPMTKQKNTLSEIEFSNSAAALDEFLHKVSRPFVVVSSIKENARDAVCNFLLNLNAPVYLEGISGLREEKRLAHLSIARTDKLWEAFSNASYPIDGVLRIGGVPTFRFWRDLEDKYGEIEVHSINDVPFSGLSWGPISCVPLAEFFKEYSPKSFSLPKQWMTQDKAYREKLLQLFEEEPHAETTLIYRLSQIIPNPSLVYLGNSLPIREWDVAADREKGHSKVWASRGVNGIDGQISTFLGLSRPNSQNWGIFGDLTTIYDLAAPWILKQLPEIQANIVIINNGGGQIFSRFIKEDPFINTHQTNFAPFAQLWGLSYEKWNSIPALESIKNSIIEIIPDNCSSERFNNKINQI